MDRTGTSGVHDVLVAHAERTPDAPIWVVVDRAGAARSITWADFLDQVERCAVVWDGMGVAAGDAVVLHVGTSIEFLVAFFGLLRLGALAVPTNLASPAPELAHVVRTTGARHVLVEPAHDAVIDELERADGMALATRVTTRAGAGTPARPDTVVLEDLVAAVAPGQRLDRPPPRGLAPAEVLFTSGTTSAPKGAVLSHRNLVRAGQRVALHFEIGAGDRPMSVMPLFHTGGQCMGVMAALVVGATGVLVERYSASMFWSTVRAQRATFVMLVPTHVRTLLAQPPDPDDGVHSLHSTGFGLRITDAERDTFESRFGVRLTYCYGQTEACLNIAIAPLHGPRNWPALGPPAFDREVRLVDPVGTDVPAGDVGEIIVAATPGRDVMLGYANDPAATAATIRDGWLWTGDNGRFDEHGHLHFFDRRKDMIKRAGENISALEVESILAAHPDVLEAAVIGVPDHIREEAVKAFVVARPGSRLDEAAITAHCAGHLASFKVPTEVEFRDELPHTSIGKINKGALRHA